MFHALHSSDPFYWVTIAALIVLAIYLGAGRR